MPRGSLCGAWDDCVSSEHRHAFRSGLPRTCSITEQKKCAVEGALVSMECKGNVFLDLWEGMSLNVVSLFFLSFFF